jgi:hypothetical protein
MRLVAGLLLGLMLSFGVHGFSLRGPYADWMTPALGYHLPGEFGGPMPVDEEYRWNVPLVTYGFDPSFVEYFGSNGIAAVEAAMGIINALPPASEIILSNFPLSTLRESYWASLESLIDLQSKTLCVLLQQLGLANPVQNMFRLRNWDPILLTDRFTRWDRYDEAEWPPGTVPNLIQKYNFDPEILAATNSLNGAIFATFVASSWRDPVTNIPELAYMPLFRVNPLDITASIINSFQYGNSAGGFTRALNRDEAGGLRYLYSSNNINFEALLDGVHGVGANAASYVDRAFRPGVEKIRFARADYDSLLDRVTVPLTNAFVDTYLVDGVVHHQQVERVITQPDIVFEVADLYDQSNDVSPTWLGVRHTGTENWLKTATAEPARGPGIIRPRFRVTYHPTSPEVVSGVFGTTIEYLRWGSFDGTAAPPIEYPLNQPGTSDTLSVRFKLFATTRLRNLMTAEWSLPVLPGGRVSLEASTNLIDWSGVTVTNQASPIIWSHTCQGNGDDYGTESPSWFFRVRPE